MVKEQWLTTVNILHQCAEIEATLAELYDFFSTTYRGIPAVSRVFGKIATEEKNHEQQIRLVIKRFAPRISTLNLDGDDVRQHLELVRSSLQQAREKIPLIEQALELSIKIESEYNRFHVDAAVRFKDEACSRLFKALMAGGEDHAVSLRQALENARSLGDSVINGN
jgi:rubrerythrin